MISTCNLFTKSLYIFLICSYTVSCQKRQETRKKNKRIFLVETRSKNSASRLHVNLMRTRVVK